MSLTPDVIALIAKNAVPPRSELPLGEFGELFFRRGVVTLVRCDLIEQGHNGDNYAADIILSNLKVPHCMAYTDNPNLGHRHQGLSSAYGNLKKEYPSRGIGAVLGFAISVNKLTPDALHDERLGFFASALCRLGIGFEILSTTIADGTLAIVGDKRLTLQLIPNLHSHNTEWATSPYEQPLVLP